MKTDLARIRELEAELKPLRDANCLCAKAVALEALHAHGFRAAARDVGPDGTQRLRSGVIDVFIDGLSSEQAPTVQQVLGRVEEAYGVRFHCESRVQATEQAHPRAFEGMHFEWNPAKNVVVVVDGNELQNIDLAQLNASLLDRAAAMRLEVQLNFSDEERSAMLNLEKATELMGSKLAALEWMSRPALGLDQQRPAALLRTTDGAQAVEDFLERLCHGVYT